MADDPTLSRQLLEEQVRMLAHNVPAQVMGTMLAAVGTAALVVAYGQALDHTLIWLGAITAMSAVRWWFGKACVRAGSGRDVHRWKLWFVGSSVIAGALWGSLALFALDPDDTQTQAVVVIALAGIVCSATQSYAPYFPAHLAFAVPALLPITVRCLASETARGVALGFMALAFLVMAELFARRIAGSIADAMRLRFENESLAAALARERDRAEAANRAKTRFLATASHDLRQPIHAMGLFVPALQSMARREQVAPQALGAVADRMQLALQTMSQLLGRLLDVSRLDAGVVDVKARDIELEPLVMTTVDEVTTTASSKGLDIRVRLPGLWVHSDPAVLHAILSNLLGNAVRYTRRGGILVAARRRGDEVLLQVWDTGIGIADGDQARLSEEFFQGGNAHEDASQSRGFGLGLAIAQRSARLLGSTLHWRSRLGRGSVFELRLPMARPIEDAAAEATEATADMHASATALPTSGRHLVLVVDQDEDILTSMSFLLKVWGFPSLIARTLDDARHQVAQHGAQIAGALVDYHLSSTENGLSVARLLRAQVHEELPIAIVTGDTTPEVMAAVRDARLVLLHKPANAQAVQAFVVGTRTRAG